MDWLRWWHGTVNDPKFGWVARKSGQTVASVVAVWACLLECASTATHCNADATRGNVASFDCNVADVLLGLDDGSVQSIYDAMVEKKMIDCGRLTKWDERQPKREDSGNPNTGALSSTERSRLHREKKKRDATDATEMQRSATHEHDRLDKSREDITTHTPSAPALISMVMRKYSIQASPSHPTILAIAEQGVSVETVEACCKETREAKPNETISVGYIAKKLEGWRAAAQRVQVSGAEKGAQPPSRKQSRHSGFDQIDYREGVSSDGSF